MKAETEKIKKEKDVIRAKCQSLQEKIAEKNKVLEDLKKTL